MAKDDVVRELSQYLHAPKQTFSKGITQTSNDSIMGFASNLKNMQVDVDGSVIRRKGTIVISEEKIRFIKFYNTTISGVDITFAFSGKGRLYAYVSTLKKMVLVARKTINGAEILPAESFTEVYFLENTEKIRIVFDSGKTYTINKRGYFAIMEVANNSYNPEQWIENARNTTSPTAQNVVIEIKDTTYYPINQLKISEVDISNYNIPMKGEVRVAPVNDEGQIGVLETSIDVGAVGKQLLFSADPTADTYKNIFDFTPIIPSVKKSLYYPNTQNDITKTTITDVSDSEKEFLLVGNFNENNGEIDYYLMPFWKETNDELQVCDNNH